MKNNKILVFKTGYNSIMMKGNVAIDMSESILNDSIVEISDQFSYINTLLEGKFASYQEKKKTTVENIGILLNRVTYSDLETLKKMIELKMSQFVGFDMSVGSELNF